MGRHPLNFWYANFLCHLYFFRRTSSAVAAVSTLVNDCTDVSALSSLRGIVAGAAARGAPAAAAQAGTRRGGATVTRLRAALCKRV